MNSRSRLNFHNAHLTYGIYPVNRKAVPVCESFVQMWCQMLFFKSAKHINLKKTYNIYKKVVAKLHKLRYSIGA